MGVEYNSSIVTSNLVFAYDAANMKSLNIPGQADHGWSDWICLASGTATYSIVDAGVTIYQRTDTGVVTTVVSTSTGPTRGTFTVTAGYTYYSLGGPINLVCEDGHHAIAPLTMSGTLFWYSLYRYNPLNIHVYSPYSNAMIKYYDNVASGINSTASNTVNVSVGAAVIFVSSNLNNGIGTSSGQSWITANVPVIATARGTTDGDRTILSPMDNYIYRRFPGWIGSSINTSPTLNNANYFTLYDTVNKVMDMNIADGSGGDASQGLGPAYLSDTYSWGNYLSDYVIAAPYDNTIVSVQYYANSAWNILENHTLTGGTITNATGIARDGSAGVGNSATNLSGAANNFNTSQLWKWVGNKPFYLCINDSTDDEFSVLGWRQSTYYSKPRTGNTWINLVNGANNLTIVGGAISNNGVITFNDDQVTQYCVNSSFPYPVDDSTQDIWFYKKATVATPLTYSVGGDNHQLLYFSASTSFQPWSLSNASTFTITSTQNSWIHCARTRFKATGLESYYINGVLVGTAVSAPGTSLTSGGALIVGQESDAPMASGGGFDPGQNLDGSVGRISIYNRALSAAEVKQNFNATRGRYGI